MIICHKYRFIFIKTRKTAGSSVEIALSRLCQEGDIVTPLSIERGEEDLRHREGGYGPTGHKKPVLQHKGFKGWRKLLLRGQKASYGQHMKAKKIKKLVGAEVWDNYLKITIERNPWDRALSRYWWQKHRWEKMGGTEFPDISEYLRWMEINMPQWITNWDHYTIDNRIAVDRVLFFENLNDELRDLSDILEVDEKFLRLPEKKLKGGFRQDKRYYWEVLSNIDRSLIERVCRREIESFGYRFL
jgi:hypothetical protein